ncbi:MAG: hypothetical protein EXR68_07510 [Dehalococcoidia bacterium]|nr:hypothetical protein [Dehalococcoidia bacterium]
MFPDRKSAAQRSASAAPALRVTVADRDVGVNRLRFTRWYTDSEADGAGGVAVPADESLIRARIDAGAGTLFVQCVASPSASSTYSAWS